MEFVAFHYFQYIFKHRCHLIYQFAAVTTVCKDVGNLVPVTLELFEHEHCAVPVLHRRTVYHHAEHQPQRISHDMPFYLFYLFTGSPKGDGGANGAGGASYSIPIEILPGTNGMQPIVSLNYPSQGGDGNFGWGWGLTGFSSISSAGTDVQL